MWRLVPALAILCAATRAADRKDVEFAHPDDQALLLDLHTPIGTGPFPAAILVHCGGFDEGSRGANVRPLFAPLADAGGQSHR